MKNKGFIQIAELIIIAFLLAGISVIGSKVIDLQKEMDVESGMSFGSTRFVASKVYRLAGSGIGTSDTSITLQSFTAPVSDHELTMADFGSIGYATIDPGTSKKEFISFTGVSQDANSTKATLTGVTRGLQFTYPYTASSSLARTHSGGAKLIISNPPQLYNRLATKDNDETITGTWTFSSSSFPKLDSYKAPTANEEFAPKKYIDDIAISGSPDASETVKGIVEIADYSELTVGTATGSTGAILVLPNSFASTSSSASSTIVISKTNGKIDQSYLDLTESWSFNGATTFSGTTTFNGTTTISGQLTISGDATSTGEFNFATTTFSVIPTLPASNPTSDNQATRKAYVDAGDLQYVQLTPTADGLSTIGAWTPWDLSSPLGANAVYAVILVPHYGDQRYGVRAGDDDSNRYITYGSWIGGGFDTWVVPVDTTTTVDIYQQADREFYLIGYWETK